VHKSQLQVAVTTKFCTHVPSICWSSEWNLLHVTLLACRFLENLCTCGHDHFVWDCEEVTLTDRKLAGQTYTVWWKNSGVSASQETSVNLPSAWQCKAAHKSEDLGSHHRILLDSVMPPTLQPWPSTLTFPPIWSLERNYQWYKL